MNKTMPTKLVRAEPRLPAPIMTSAENDRQVVERHYHHNVQTEHHHHHHHHVSGELQRFTLGVLLAVLLGVIWFLFVATLAQNLFETLVFVMMFIISGKIVYELLVMTRVIK